MAYIANKKLRIFPISQRTARTQDNWISEYNLSSVVNQFIDPSTQGFVISQSTGKDESLEFNIKGYYFRVDNAGDIVAAVDGTSRETDSSPVTTFVTFGKNDSGYYTANIYLDEMSPSPILRGNDTGTGTTTAGTGHELQLFKVDSEGNYSIPETSRLSVVGLAPVGGKGLSIQVRGSAIQSYRVEAKGVWSQGEADVVVEDGIITDLNLKAAAERSNSKVCISNGTITELTIDDGELTSNS